MTKFEGCYLTNAGLEMVHSTGLGRIIFTRAETGSGAYDSKEDIPEMARLKNQKQAFGLDSLTEGENFTVDVKFTIRNKGLEAGYQLSEIGIYAKVDDGEEKLYCVAFALPGNTEEVPPDEGGSIAYVTAVNIETVVSTDCEVSVIYAADHEWTVEYVEGVAEKINAVLVNKVDKEKGKGLSTEDYTTAEKEKLKEIEEKANNYIHPESHPASMIEQNGTHRFVSDDQINNWDEALEESQKYTDAAYQQSTGYTDQAIADLIGGAPELRNTLKELSDAIDENGDIAEALNAAIGEKADQKVMESLLGQKLDSTGDAKGNTVSFTSSDTTTPSGWMNFDLFKSGDTIKAIMEKISIKARNLRYIWKLLGSTDISSIGDGTVTGALNSLNSKLPRFKSIGNFYSFTSSTTLDYTGISIDVPPETYLSMNVIFKYNHGEPIKVGITTSPTNISNLISTATQGESHASCSYSGYTPTGVTLYFVAQYGNVSINELVVDGFYVSV